MKETTITQQRTNFKIQLAALVFAEQQNFCDALRAYFESSPITQEVRVWVDHDVHHDGTYFKHDPRNKGLSLYPKRTKQ